MIPGLVSLLSFLVNAGLQVGFTGLPYQVKFYYLRQADQQQNVTDMIMDDDRNENDDRITTTAANSAGGGDALQQTANQQNVLNTIRQNIGKFRGDEHRQAGYVVLLSESIQACMTVS